MKKILFSLLFIFTLIFSNVREVDAYNFTENSYYIVMDIQTIGQVKVYIPVDKVEYLQVTQDRTNVVNVSSGSVYGYFTSNNTDYRITFNTYSTNTYRTVDGNGYTNTDLIINSIIETNILHLKIDEDLTFIQKLINDENTAIVVNILLLIVIIWEVLLLWLKH